MFGIFVHYSTRPIYDVSMNLFCWLPSVDILNFNILHGFLWQSLLTRSVYKAVGCSRTNKNAEWRSGESTLLPSMWSGFESWRRRHRCIWVEFVVGSRPCSERFFALYFFFPSPKNKKHFQIPFRSRTHGHVSTTSWELLNAPWEKKCQVTIFWLVPNLYLSPSLYSGICLWKPGMFMELEKTAVFVEGLNVINGPKRNKVLNVITLCPKCSKVLNVITICPKCNKLSSCQLR